PLQSPVRIGRDSVHISPLAKCSQRLCRIIYVARREIEPLGPGWWHNMSGVATEQQATMTHRREDVRAKRRDGLLDRRAPRDVRRNLGAKAQRQLIPDALVRPVLKLLGERNVHIIAAARMAA